MNTNYHYPPDLIELLIDTIPLLCKSKNSLLTFFSAIGVNEKYLNNYRKKIKTDKNSITKYDITRSVITKINELGDSYLTVRRELIKRVTDWDDFSTCWPTDQMKARGCVSAIREIVNKKDSFVRMQEEREIERTKNKTIHQKKLEETLEKNKKIDVVKQQINNLFNETNPQERGRKLESLLTQLFKIYGILVREPFTMSDEGSIYEQIDGVVIINKDVYLVEIKWHKEPIGVQHLAQHISRLFARSVARGIIISASGYTKSAIKQCEEALSQKVVSLCTLKEIILLLEKYSDLTEMLEKKIHSAIIEKNPFVEML